MINTEATINFGKSNVMAYNLNGKYPAMANYLIVSRNKKDIYRVENVLTEDIFEFDAVTYRFLKCLDGNTNPKKIGRRLGVDVDELMDFFDMNLLIRTDGKELLSGTSNKLVTCYVPAKKRTNSIIPKLLNRALVLAWLPIFSCGVERYCYKTFYMNDDYMVIGYLFALLVGLVLHEVAHAVACLAYGGYFFEAGIMPSIFSPGAYVLIDYQKIKSKFKKIQITAAGVEMNMLLAGVFLILSSYFEALSGFFFMAAFTNIILAIMNLSCVNGFDGCTIMFELLGIEGGMDRVRSLLRNVPVKSKEHKPSVAVVATCVVLQVFQILFPIILINNVLIIFGGFLI